MKFLVTYRPTALATMTTPDQDGAESMQQYADRMTKAGVLLSQGMFDPQVSEVHRSGGRFMISETDNKMMGFAFLHAASKDEAIEYTKEFLNVAGDGVTRVLQVLE